MIQELKVKNYKSFKDEATLSFEATDDTLNEAVNVVEMPDGMRLLRLALVMGANASGKSNLLNAFEFLFRFWVRKPSDLMESTLVEPFLLDGDTPTQPSEFSIKFYTSGHKYWYRLSITRQVVLHESLFRYTSVRPTKIFERKYHGGQSVLSFNPAAVKISPSAVERLTLACLPNMSLFAARNQVNVAIPEMDAAKESLCTGVMPCVRPEVRMFEYAIRKMANDADLKDYLLDFIHKADFNISNIKIETRKTPIPDQLMDVVMNDTSMASSIKEQLKAKGMMEETKAGFIYSVENEHGTEQYALREEQQSAGTQRMLGVEAAIYETIRRGALLCADEIESSLHPDLVEFIIQKFLQSHNEAQLLVSTHYDPLLDTIGDLIRKDSVWFAEKDTKGATSLYSLVEFNGLSRISSFRAAYHNGHFGALPNIKN